MSRDTDFVLECLANLPTDVIHNELFALAVEVLVSGCPKIKNLIWQEKASMINTDLLEDGTLSSGERYLAEAAISLWTYGASKVELWTLLNKLDGKHSQNLIRALMIIHYWDAAEKERGEKLAKQLSKHFSEKMDNE